MSARSRLALLLAATIAVISAASIQDADRVEALSPYDHGRCAWLVQPLADVGLPQSFLRIAWREGGCRQQPKCVVDRDDASCSRFGLNFKGRGMVRYWSRLCGADSMYDTRNLSVDLRCTAKAYKQLGMRPWR